MSNSRGMGIEELLARFGKLEAFGKLGYQASVNGQGDLLICHCGHWRGMWRHSAGVYNWIVAGSRMPSYETSCVEEAVAFSAQHIFVE